MSGARIGLKIVGLIMTLGFVVTCLYWFTRPFNPMVYVYAILGIIGLAPMVIEKFNWKVALINRIFLIISLIGLVSLIITRDVEFIILLCSSFVVHYLAGACYIMAVTSDPRFAEAYMEHNDCYIVVKYLHNRPLALISDPGWFLAFIIAPDGNYPPLTGFRNAYSDRYRTRTERVRFSHLSEAKSYASGMSRIDPTRNSKELLKITFSNGLFGKNMTDVNNTKPYRSSGHRNILPKLHLNGNARNAFLMIGTVVYVAIVLWVTVRCYTAYTTTADTMESIFGTVVLVLGPAITGLYLCRRSTVGSIVVGVIGIMIHIFSLMNNEPVLVEFSVPAMIGCILLVILAMVRSTPYNLYWHST